MLIYTPVVTSRVTYIFSTLLGALGIHNISFSCNRDHYTKAGGAKLNYSLEAICPGEFWLKPVNLLFETGVQPQQVTCFKYNGVKAFFTSGPDLPFDVFAASFYLLSRYEEYLPHKTDFYGRYAHENSLAFNDQFLSVPLVNIWLQDLSEQLQQRFSFIKFILPKFKLIPTYDIDIAWSHKKKGLYRNAGGLLWSLMEAEWQRAAQRLNVLFGSEKDPFDCYEWLHRLHATHNLLPVYFFLVAAKNKGYDKNILPSTAALQKLIKHQSQLYSVGLHPSWQSGDNASLLAAEKLTLEKIVDKPVAFSRQHYIRMQLPGTYRQLINAGISHDYSMGYGSINGFRASYCLPFLWYDLQSETTTNLTVHPFCFMDANSFYEQRFTSSETLNEMRHYHNATKAVNGEMILIWHNHFLGTDTLYAGFKEVYEQFINEVT